MSNKNIYYNIYSEFYNINKYRELKSMVHHGNNRLDHIKRVSKMSFYVSKKCGLDYVSCTRGALLHDFFTSEDINRTDSKYNDFLHNHPQISLDNSKKYFKLNEVEEDIILSHMFPIVKGKPKYAESKVVCICDKLVSIYEFFRYKLKLSANIMLLLILNR